MGGRLQVHIEVGREGKEHGYPESARGTKRKEEQEKDEAGAENTCLR